MRQFVRLFDRLFARFFLVLYFFLASLSEKKIASFINAVVKIFVFILTFRVTHV